MRIVICLHSAAVVVNVSQVAYVTKERKLARITVISDSSATLAAVKLHSAQTLPPVFPSVREIRTVRRDVVHLVIARRQRIFAKLDKRWIMIIVMETLSVNRAFVSTKNALQRLQ